MNTRAGWKLYGRKPSSEPASRAHSTATTGWTGATTSEMTPSVVTAISEMPASRPSSPSMKLTLLIMPTIHSVVTATAAASPIAGSISAIGSPNGLGSRSMQHAAGEGDAGQHELADELPARPELIADRRR